ncbi:MAG: 2,4-dienoyl-CoA reductase-like NADH-dependent reductase (Old Yellow Enzyme family) [Gammaproteobacteria bacterium]|jgi:2,4-dienoyl-CoA reductase-like NADH-dependent reductase (Old Yellow Enzyme family)
MVDTTRYSHLLKPLSIGPTTVRHRIMVTGHTQLYGRDQTLSERHIAYYAERAKGGAALLILEQQAAHPAGRNYSVGCSAWDEKAIPWFERLGEAVHAYDCKQFVQLFCAGAQGSGTQYMDDWRPLWAASRIPSAISEEMPVAMDAADIKELAQYFADSALNVQRAGLDGIEIHAAHSQLLGEFLSPAFNKRSDAYGGSLEKRCRIVLEIGEAVRAAVGPDLCLGLRLSFDEFLGPAGITPEQSEEQIEIFSRSGLFDFFDISGGGYHALHVAVAPMGTVAEGFLADSAARAKAVAGDRAKIFVVGRFLDLDKAEAVLAAGSADMVAMTRAHMADPFVVEKSLQGREQDVTRCIGANVCVSRLIANREVTCFQNPAMGREAQWGDGTLDKIGGGDVRDISVIGAGPAGLRFALTAARRGHRIQIFEAAEHPGGRLLELSALPTRTAWQEAIANLTGPLATLGVQISCGNEVTDSNIPGDIIVCATGSSWDRSGYSPYRPERDSIPGAEADFVIDMGSAIERAIADPKSLGGNVLIVDETGEYHPLGLAELLSMAGVKVEILTPRPFVGAETQRTLDLPHVMPRLKAAGVLVTSEHFIERIDDRAALVYDIWGGEPMRRSNLDTIVFAMTKSPQDRLFESLRASGKTVVKIGDVVAPRAIEAIFYEAEKAARAI